MNIYLEGERNEKSSFLMQKKYEINYVQLTFFIVRANEIKRIQTESMEVLQKEFQIIVWRRNILTVLVPNSYFRPMRIFHAILPESLPRATIKRRGNILSPSFTKAFRAGQTCPVFLFALRNSKLFPYVQIENENFI